MQFKVTYGCGHEGYINITKKSEMWRKEERYLTLCPECYKKHLEYEKEQAAKKKAEEVEKSKIELGLQLPELKGTEKQVKWANSIRENLVLSYKKIAEDKFSVMYPLREKFKNYLENEESAENYIKKNRISLSTLYDFLEEYQIVTEEEKVAEKETKKESLVVPENFNNKPAYVIEEVGEEIKVSGGERNEEVRNYLKNKDFSWENYSWCKKIVKKSYYEDNTIERIAEIGNKLLSLGWAVSIMNSKAREKAIKGDFIPELHKFIIKKEENIKIIWKGQNDKIYKASRELPKSKWNNGGTIVNPVYFREVRDFAELYNFKITDEAEKLLKEYEEKINSPTNIKFKGNDEKIGEEKLKEILNSPAEVLEDLKEED